VHGKSIREVSFEEGTKRLGQALHIHIYTYYMYVYMYVYAIKYHIYVYILYIVYNHCAWQVYQWGIIWNGNKKTGAGSMYICIHITCIIYMYLCMYTHLLVTCLLKNGKRLGQALYLYIYVYILYVIVYYKNDIHTFYMWYTIIVHGKSISEVSFEKGWKGNKKIGAGSTYTWKYTYLLYVYMYVYTIKYHIYVYILYVIYNHCAWQIY